MTVPNRLILGIDPGNVTGWSWWKVPAHEAASRLDYGIVEHGLAGFVHDLVADNYGKVSLKRLIQHSDLVVFERFSLNGDAVNPQTEALEIQGALKLHMARKDRADKLVLHERGKKRAVRDEVLKEAGLYLTKSGIKEELGIEWTDARDINDSQIHVLAYLKEHGHSATIKEYWGHI